MSKIGMKYLVAAPITAYTEGSPITYGNGMVIGPAVAADLNIVRDESKDYGDNVVINSDNGVTDVNGTVEATSIAIAARAAVLGWKAVGSPTTHYAVTDAAPPYVGWGFIENGVENGVQEIAAYWFHRSQFGQNNISARTKEGNIAWRHPTMSVQGTGVIIDNSGETHWYDWMAFESIAAAKAWLFARANISAATT